MCKYNVTDTPETPKNNSTRCALVRRWSLSEINICKYKITDISKTPGKSLKPNGRTMKHGQNELGKSV